MGLDLEIAARKSAFKAGQLALAGGVTHAHHSRLEMDATLRNRNNLSISAICCIIKRGVMRHNGTLEKLGKTDATEELSRGYMAH
jgi:hypothetical protein